jgi:hypothetical protein
MSAAAIQATSSKLSFTTDTPLGPEGTRVEAVEAMLHASTLLSWLVQARSADEIERIRSEAVALNADEDGRLDLDAVARLGVPSEVAALSTKLSSTYGRRRSSGSLERRRTRAGGSRGSGTSPSSATRSP